MTVRKYTSRSQQTTLSSAVTSGATVIPVTNASTLFAGTTISAGQTFTIVIDPDTALEEICDVTAASSNNLTVTRAVDMSGASAQDHSSGAVVRHMMIGRDLRESNLHIEATGSYNDGTGAHTLHGLGTSDGVVVGTDATQTLTNKTLTAPVLTGAGVDASIVFEGSTADAFETTLTVVDPTQDNVITLPNTTGTVTILTATQTMTNKTLTSPTISGSPVITGLSSAGMSASSAAPKSYVDAILVLQEASAASSAVSAASSAASATAAATSATSAAASATAAATSATSAAASVSSIAGYATTASNSAAAAATSATSAAASATAAATSATSAAASATTAANSATTATTQAAAAVISAASAATSATAAATSATSAAASATTAAASVATIATYASDALTSANSAATSAASAAASTSAAATSAASAATSASSAATSATAAAASYDSFDDRYLGSKSTPPTTDNDGNALIEGALYWNSVDNAMYAWTGTEWGSISSTAAIYRFRYTAAGGETSKSGPDDSGVTLSYLPGKEQVYLNGVLLVRAQDYTATSGTNITALSPALASGDILEIITFTSFDLATAIPNTIFDAKGDLLVGTAADTAGKISVGSNGQYLQADSSTATGLTWSTVSGYSAPTLGTTVVTSGVTITTISGLTDVVLNGPGSVADELTLLLMGAL
jgi:hypothetical protein